MKKKVRLVLEITVADLAGAERAEGAQLAACSPRELPRLDEVNAFEIADAVRGAIENYEDIFAGSDIYAKIKGVKIISNTYRK